MMSYQSSMDLYWFSLTVSLASKERPSETGPGMARAGIARAAERTRNFMFACWLEL